MHRAEIKAYPGEVHKFVQFEDLTMKHVTMSKTRKASAFTVILTEVHKVKARDKGCTR